MSLSVSALWAPTPFFRVILSIVKITFTSEWF
jgi:hypothetical protein